MELTPFNVKNMVVKDELHRRPPERTVVEAIIKDISRVNQGAFKVFGALLRHHPAVRLPLMRTTSWSRAHEHATTGYSRIRQRTRRYWFIPQVS
jgi:hypothetical protein